jgi:NAD(P)-dependent dehydrogenase (short-subunit alcohol dehydrogenase family)
MSGEAARGEKFGAHQDIDHLVSEIHKGVGPLDILVNNAGIFPMAETAQIDETTFDQIIATNVKAPFYLTAAFAFQMAERGSGNIINITVDLTLLAADLARGSFFPPEFEGHFRFQKIRARRV